MAAGSAAPKAKAKRKPPPLPKVKHVVNVSVDVPAQYKRTNGYNEKGKATLKLQREGSAITLRADQMRGYELTVSLAHLREAIDMASVEMVPRTARAAGGNGSSS